MVFGSLCDATTICSSVRRYLHFVRLCIILYLYAQHPLGGRRHTLALPGICAAEKKDFKIRCTGCGREVMLPRAKIEKNIKKVVKPGSAQ